MKDINIKVDLNNWYQLMVELNEFNCIWRSMRERDLSFMEVVKNESDLLNTIGNYEFVIVYLEYKNSQYIISHSGYYEIDTGDVPFYDFLYDNEYKLKELITGNRMGLI